MPAGQERATRSGFIEAVACAGQGPDGWSARVARARSGDVGAVGAGDVPGAGGVAPGGVAVVFEPVVPPAGGSPVAGVGTSACSAKEASLSTTAVRTRRLAWARAMRSTWHPPMRPARNASATVGSCRNAFAQAARRHASALEILATWRTMTFAEAWPVDVVEPAPVDLIDQVDLSGAQSPGLDLQLGDQPPRISGVGGGHAAANTASTPAARRSNASACWESTTAAMRTAVPRGCDSEAGPTGPPGIWMLVRAPQDRQAAPCGADRGEASGDLRAASRGARRVRCTVGGSPRRDLLSRTRLDRDPSSCPARSTGSARPAGERLIQLVEPCVDRPRHRSGAPT